MECPQVGCDGLIVAMEPPVSRGVFHFDRETALEPPALPPVVPGAMPEQPLELWTLTDLMVTVGRRMAARGRMALASRTTVTAR